VIKSTDTSPFFLPKIRVLLINKPHNEVLAMKEVEILVQVKDSKEAALERLKSFQFEGTKETVDAYFFNKETNRFKPDKNGRLLECLRLRTKSGKSYLAYKYDHFDDNGTWTYSDEYEVEVSDNKTAEELIKHLGFEELVVIDNVKYTYKTDYYEIVLEDVKDLGIFLEVERNSVGDDEDVLEVKKEIWKFIESLDIEVTEELNAGKPELMLRSQTNEKQNAV
ncbi:MAG TPA: class IV adenylate cyclase, partial [Flavobacterium sp.]|nr:class IV adenylate cyclase [Flavobacterium sp.]